MCLRYLSHYIVIGGGGEGQSGESTEEWKERGRRTVAQIDSTDAEIDRLVYSLYGLTDQEIAIVESESF